MTGTFRAWDKKDECYFDFEFCDLHIDQNGKVYEQDSDANGFLVWKDVTDRYDIEWETTVTATDGQAVYAGDVIKATGYIFSGDVIGSVEWHKEGSIGWIIRKKGAKDSDCWGLNSNMEIEIIKTIHDKEGD